MPIILLAFVAIIFSVFSAAVFAGHYFIYWSIKIFFGVENKKTKRRLALILALLAISFGFSSVIAHFSENVVTQVLYFLAGLWLGIAMNLDMALFLGLVTVGLGRLGKRYLNLRIVGIVSILAALLFSGWGVWEAYHPKITEVTVKIKNLPPAWEGKKVVHLSDLHLGHVFGDWFLARAINQFNSFSPEAVFITGDLFDGMDGQLTKYVSPLNNLAVPSGTYFVTGNHETYLGVNRTYAALDGTKIKILKDEMAEVNGLQILGVSFPEKSEAKDIEVDINKMPGYDPESPSILLYHSPLEARRAKNAGVDLMLAGHTHAGQVFPFTVLMKILFWGNDYGLHEDGDFTLYTTSGLGCWGITMRTFAGPEIVVITLENKN